LLYLYLRTEDFIHCSNLFDTDEGEEYVTNDRIGQLKTQG